LSGTEGDVKERKKKRWRRQRRRRYREGIRGKMMWRRKLEKNRRRKEDV
jgi:hypothetical protein